MIGQLPELYCRWLELTRKIEMWVEVHELSDQGEYVPVEVTQSKDVLTGGVFQLRQVPVIFSAPPLRNNFTLILM
jgi:kinesin family protein 13